MVLDCFFMMYLYGVFYDKVLEGVFYNDYIQGDLKEDDYV